MAHARIRHTATLLRNGKVLVVGGFSALLPAATLSDAELYNPTTSTWSAAAPTTGSRARHTATLLDDGRVLVVGGISFDLRGNDLVPSQPADAETYDPDANTWSRTSPMIFYRLDHSATLLADGRVLVAGGMDTSGGRQDAVTATEIFEATRGRWIQAASMGIPRWSHAATLLPNGDVLVSGGMGSEPSALAIALADAEIYHSRLDAWSPVPSMPEFHADQTATALRNGTVLVVGTSSRSRPELYDPARNRWSRTGPVMVRYRHTATRLPDGRVLIAGGFGDGSLFSAILYEPNGVARVPGKPLDGRILIALLATAVLAGAGIAWSIPAVRQRVKQLRSGGPEEWTP